MHSIGTEHNKFYSPTPPCATRAQHWHRAREAGVQPQGQLAHELRPDRGGAQKAGIQVSQEASALAVVKASSTAA
eukprot:365398-Chlamydomonas_euryale.AAC.7